MNSFITISAKKEQVSPIDIRVIIVIKNEECIFKNRDLRQSIHTVNNFDINQKYAI